MKKLLCASIISTLAFVGCSDSVTSSEESFGVSNAKTEVQTEENFGVNVLTSPIVSDPANDPYTVENMSKAMRKQLLAKSADPQEVELMTLEPNYLYVRFLAEGKEGVAQLKAYDTSLVLFKHPLDYKPIRKPVVYKDPSLPDNVIPMFATVPVDYDFGPTKYEVIKELFLVEPLDGENETDSKSLLKKAADVSSASVLSKMEAMGVSLQDVEWESLNMTGNLSNRVKDSGAQIGKNAPMAWSLFSSAKKLGGQLKFKDDYLGDQPLVGVRVTGGYSYYWREAHTDKDGKFRIPEKWSFDIDYEANFDSDEFLLEDGHSVYGEDLEIEKNNKHSDWNETFTGDKAKWCIVWTAAYQYYYGDIEGLHRPRQNEWYNFSLDIQVYYKSDSKKYVWWGKSSQASYNYVPTVADWVEINTKNRKSREIYANVMHELAHSSHYENMSTHQWYYPQSVEFSNLPTRLKETYAVGIDYYFQKKRYGNKGGAGWDGYGRIYDYWSSNGYTGLVQDLIDNDSYFAKDAEKSKKTGDAVSGFTINEIENAVIHSTSWNGLRDYIKKNYPANSKRKYKAADMDKLFDYWSK